MGLLSYALNTFGLVLLTHAYVYHNKQSRKPLTHNHSVYSAYEHSLLPRATSAAPTSSSLLSSLNPKIDLPLDITIETLFSVLILCVGVVLGSPDLQPIQWRVWAGKLEREKAARSNEGGLVGNPYKALDERVGFLDIRAKRKEFAEWVREGDKAGQS